MYIYLRWYWISCIWQGRNREIELQRNWITEEFIFTEWCFLAPFYPFLMHVVLERETIWPWITLGFSYKYLKMASDFGRRSDVICMCSRLEKGGQVRGNYVVTNESVILLSSDIWTVNLLTRPWQSGWH